MLGLDYSSGRPTAAQIRAAGYGFVMRYLDNGLSGRANLTSTELMDLNAGGVRTGVVWESQASRAAAGFTAGQADARAADVAAKAVGVAGWPIYFAVDFDLPDYAPAADGATATGALEKLGPVGAYFGGILSVLPLARVGVYGGYWVVKRVLDAGLAYLAWQTVAWSGGNVDPRIHLFQHVGYVMVGGVQCDVNEAHQDDFGWKPATVMAAGKDDDMFQFYVDNTKATTGGNYSDDGVLLVIGGTAYPSTNGQLQAKKAEHTAEIAGLEHTGAGGFVDVRDTSAALRAAPAKLDALLAAIQALPSGGGTAGASKAEVEQVVDAAFADHNATLTYNKIVGN
jgi:hypothetical protein